ncbi:MAG TPA: DnaJ family domain-containing protein [Ktedonobacterales bacterium]|jgi:DnaJ family protein C protein 28
MSDTGNQREPGERDAAHPPRRAGRPWASIVDEQIRDAFSRGDFDNLPGAGRPLDLTENPFAGDRAAAFNLLKSHGVAPREIELGREIDADQAAAQAPLDRLRWRRDQLAARLLAPFTSERRAYNVLRQSTRARYADELRALNSKILTLNVLAPSALHRTLVDVAGLLAAFDREFPTLAE